MALALALVILTPLTALLLGQAVNASPSSMNPNYGISQLLRTLNGAYQNSLMHDSGRTDLEASDLALEDASIQLSARMLDELSEGACGSDAERVSTNECELDDPSLALGDWAEMISYAAYRLENAARSATSTAGADDSHPPVTERIESMDHLYRMVFAVTKAHLDHLQSHTYLEAAQEQIRLARQHMEAERTLCQCDPSGYATRLQKLSALGDQINSLQPAPLP
jgi:hypothetical protein